MLVTPSLRHCSNKYEGAREGEKDKLFLFYFFSLGLSQVIAAAGLEIATILVAYAPEM